jgi:hypothetical protein
VSGPGSGSGGRRRAAARTGALVGLLALAAACTDPRPRPAPPTVVIDLEPDQIVASPGPLLGTLHVSDPNGIDSILVRLELGNGAVVGDSVFFVSGNDPFHATLPLDYQLVGGIPLRTVVRLVARATSYIGFYAADTALTAVGDTL